MLIDIVSGLVKVKVIHKKWHNYGKLKKKTKIWHLKGMAMYFNEVESLAISSEIRNVRYSIFKHNQDGILSFLLSRKYYRYVSAQRNDMQCQMLWSG